MRDDHAVSSVVAAVLLFALFTTAFVLWSATTLPQEVAQREQDHQGLLMDRLADLQAGVERLAASGSPGPVTASLPMAPDPVPFLQRHTASGTLLSEGGRSFDAGFTDARLRMADGGLVGRPDAPAAGEALAGASAFRALQLRLVSSGVEPGATAWVQADLEDGQSVVSIRVTHAGKGEVCNAGELRMTVATGGGVQEALLLCGAAAALDHAVDLLDPRQPALGALGRLGDGVLLTVTAGAGGSGGPAAQGYYAAVWTTADGAWRAKGAGEEASGLAVSRPGDALRHRGGLQEHPDQDLVWEQGGVVVVQRDGQAMVRPPSLRLSVDGDRGMVEWTIVRMQVSGEAQGRAAATVSVTLEGQEEILVTAAAATLSLSGGQGAAWRQHLEDAVDAAGLVDATVSGAADTATLSLSQGDIEEWTIRLRFLEIRVEIQ